MRPAARAPSSHTGGASGIFRHAHVAAKNDSILFAAVRGRELCAAEEHNNNSREQNTVLLPAVVMFISVYLKVSAKKTIRQS